MEFVFIGLVDGLKNGYWEIKDGKKERITNLWRLNGSLELFFGYLKKITLKNKGF